VTGSGAPFARVRLARSLPRLLALPLALVALGAGAMAAGALLVEGPAGPALLGVGAIVTIAGLALALVLLSVRLEVEETAVSVSWIGGRRTYQLSPGPVTRVRLSGPNASKLRVVSGAFGWGLGRAVLRGEEVINIVRLARTPTAILVPTHRGRLAIAPADDADLLDALARAARARQRREKEAAALAEQETAATAEETPEAEADEVPEPVPMTGIERAVLEQLIAAERAVAERAAAEAAEAEAAEAQAAEAQAAADAERAEPEAAAPLPLPRRRPRVGVRRPGARTAFVLLPLLGAGLAWGVGLATGRMPEPGSDLARLTTLALVMAGPATSVGAVMALAWWPRLVGVVVTGGLVASVFIGRALLAP
jgi:hypothetical protein